MDYTKFCQFITIYWKCGWHCAAVYNITSILKFSDFHFKNLKISVCDENISIYLTFCRIGFTKTFYLTKRFSQNTLVQFLNAARLSTILVLGEFGKDFRFGILMSKVLPDIMNK